MKKDGILNRELAGLVAGLGHTDCVMICDAGFPIPDGKRYVDLALTAGTPAFDDCLRVLLQEAIFDEITSAEETREANPEVYSLLKATFLRQKWNQVPQSELQLRAANAKFIIRSGELRPYSNLLLYSASGVGAYNHSYVI